MTVVDLDADVLDARGALWTAREIAQQPALWRGMVAALGAQGQAAARFVAAALAQPERRVLLTGAGSSAFIGQVLASALRRHLGGRVEALASTDLVAAPHLHLDPQQPVLMLHFARSGSSPESVAAFDLAEQCLPDCLHLVVTCNADGALHRRVAAESSDRFCCLLLPEACHDRGFAMTSSFTGMLLAAAQAFGLLSRPEQTEALALAASSVLAHGLSRAQALAEQDFERVIYLGSNELQGLAREAALKLLELSDGALVALHDSPLGFRHGPKTIVNSRTLIVLLLSNDPHTRRYDLDLLQELRSDGRAARVLAISAQPLAGATDDDLLLAGLAQADDLGLSLVCAVFAQRLALLQSLRLGLTPDSPSVSGTVNRVVRGVTIHPFAGLSGGVDVPGH